MFLDTTCSELDLSVSHKPTRKSTMFATQLVSATSVANRQTRRLLVLHRLRQIQYGSRLQQLSQPAQRLPTKLRLLNLQRAA